MTPLLWDERLKPLQKIIMQPVIFNNLSITLLDALPALHEKDWVIDTHRHPWFEFNYVSEGAVYTSIEGFEFLTGAGHSYIIPPGTFHSHRYCDYQGDNGLCLRWQLEELPQNADMAKTPNSASKLIKVLSVPRPFCVDVNAAVLVERISRVKSHAAMQAIFTEWLLSLFDMLNACEEDPNIQNDHEKVSVRQALLYLSEYHTQDLNVQELANSLNISYRHLARMFKHVTGMTIIENLNNIRVNEAKKLLKETDKPIREIAQKVGYENEYYFTTIFNKYAYTSPSKFRKQFKV